jgi:hypothetical protein
MRAPFRAAVFIAIGVGLATILGGVAFLFEAPSPRPTAATSRDSPRPARGPSLAVGPEGTACLA